MHSLQGAIPRGVPTSFLFGMWMCMGFAYASGFAFGAQDQASAWVRFKGARAAICTGVLGAAESQGPEGSAAHSWAHYPFCVDGVLEGELPKVIVIQHPIHDPSMAYCGGGVTRLAPGARYLMILQMGTAPPMPTGDLPAYQVWNDHYFLAPTKPAGAVEGEKPWETLAREMTAAVACDDPFVAYDGMWMTALVLTAIPPGLEKGLRKWAGRDEWPLGLLAKTLLASYGDRELRHALLRRLLVEKDLPPDALSLPDWPYSLSTPSVYLKSNLAYFTSPMTDDDVSRGLIVQLALESSVQEEVRLAALGALDKQGVDQDLREKTCRALLLRPDESRRVLRQTMFQLTTIYRDAGKNLPQELYNPAPEAYAADPEPYVARWRELLTQVP